MREQLNRAICNDDRHPEFHIRLRGPGYICHNTRHSTPNPEPPMAFKFTDQHIIDRCTLGYTVFRQIIPPSLLRDLRKAAAPAHEIARKSSPRAMRLTGVERHGLACQAFKDYAELPELNDAIARTLGSPHTYGEIDPLVILIETADIPVTQAWHRDVRETEILEEHREEFNRFILHPTLINQINCPLYEDAALWYVPGSHLRADLPSEVAAAKSTILMGDHFTDEEREQRGLQYCRGMPGAVCLAMDAGDFALYHPCALHLGSVLTYRKRATIHDTATNAATKVWQTKWNGWKQEKAKRDKATAG